MSENIALVSFNDVCVRAKYENLKTLLEIAKEKLEVSSDCHLQYQEKKRRWVKICNDDDLKDIDAANTELRLVLNGRLLIKCTNL